MLICKSIGFRICFSFVQLLAGTEKLYLGNHNKIEKPVWFLKYLNILKYTLNHNEPYWTSISYNEPQQAKRGTSFKEPQQTNISHNQYQPY